MITPEFPPKVGGIGFYVFNLSRKLVERGHKVTVITEGSWKKQCEYVDGIRVYRTRYFHLRPFHIHFHGIFVNKLLKSIERDLDVVHIHLPYSPPIFTSLRVIVTVHTLARAGMTKSLLVNSMKKAVISKLIFPLDHKVLSRAEIVTSVSYTVSEELRKFHNCEVEVIGNGVDTEFFVPKENSNDSQCILFSGRLILEKGLLDLIECAKHVCDKYPSASFVLAGSGPLEETLRKSIEREGLSKNFTLLRAVDRNKLLLHYQNSTIFVLPSHYESFPNVLLEAMACGIPVVATRVCDIPKIVKDGENGFLVPPKDPYALARAIVILLEDEKLRKRMGRASRDRVEALYSLNALTEKMLSYYVFLKTH
jgi:glycosyltransferase involved in cell wall biosynthesis